MATWEDTNHDSVIDTHLGNHTNTAVLAKGFLDDPKNLGSKIADGFALIEQYDLRVESIVLHPSIVHRFVQPLQDNLDVDTTHAIVGTLWGAHVTLDPDAPRNGFILKSEEDQRCVRFVGRELPSRDPATVPTVLCKNPVRPRAIAELLDLGEQWGGTGSLRLELTAKTYMGLRKFGRDILDIETRADMLKTGLQGTVYGVKVMVSRTAPATQIVLRDDNRVYAILETDPAANPALKERTDKILNGAPQEEYVDRLMEGVVKGIDAAWTDIAYDLDDTRIEAAKSVLMRSVVERLMVRYRLGQ